MPPVASTQTPDLRNEQTEIARRTFQARASKQPYRCRIPCQQIKREPSRLRWPWRPALHHHWRKRWPPVLMSPATQAVAREAKMRRGSEDFGCHAVICRRLGVLGAWCWSNTTGSTTYLNTTCSQIDPATWQMKQYNPNQYDGPCSGISTPGCVRCTNITLPIEEQDSYWGGTQCTSPYEYSSGWYGHGSVSASKHVPC